MRREDDLKVFFSKETKKSRWPLDSSMEDLGANHLTELGDSGAWLRRLRRPITTKLGEQSEEASRGHRTD